MSEGYRKSVLPNGIRILTERMPHVRSVAVGVWVETGSRHEPEARGGVSHLIEHLVFKGTATRSAEAIARTMDSVGGQMDADDRTGAGQGVLDRAAPGFRDRASRLDPSVRGPAPPHEGHQDGRHARHDRRRRRRPETRVHPAKCSHAGRARCR